MTQIISEALQQDMNIEELLKQVIEGTDDLSMARGLAYSLLTTLTATAHEVSECLYKGEENAEGILSLISGNIEFIQHNVAIIQEMTANFEGVCAEVRKEKA